MHFNASLLILAVLAALSLAAPVTSKHALQKRHFKVPVNGGSKRSPAHAMARAYNKFGWEVIIFNSGQSGSDGYGPQSSSAPPASAPPSAPTQSPSKGNGSSSGVAQPTASPSPTNSGDDGEVTATPEAHDSEYLSPVTVGGQALNLNLDTGSADLWVFSTQLSSAASNGHSIFDPTKSSTWKDYQGASWMISYGDGSTASGSVGYDTVDIGGTTVQGQCVELADEISSKLASDQDSDGIVGLGFSNVNTVVPKPQKTFFDNVMDDLDQPVFTVDLTKTDGTYEFGTIDTSRYNGQLHYTPIDSSNGYWQFDSKTYSVGGKQGECTICSPAIADTGTSLIIVDDDVAAAYYAQVPGASLDPNAGGYTFKCGTSLPDFGVAIGDGYTAIVKGADMTYAPVEEGSSTCFGGAQPNGASAGSGAAIQVYGDVLLKSYFVVFDGGNNRVGFAEKN